MKIYYITSETQNTCSGAERWNSFDKRMILKKCWLSFISNLTQEDSVKVFYNNVNPTTVEWMSSSCSSLISFYESETIEDNFLLLHKHIKQDLEEETNPDTIFAIVEDDFLWSPGSLSLVKDSFSLWNGFIVPADTILNFRKPLFSKVFLGKDRYWKTSNVISWTLLGKLDKWKEHIETLGEALQQHNIVNYNSLTLNDWCINPMPAVASHLRNGDMSPYVDWAGIWERIKI